MFVFLVIPVSAFGSISPRAAQPTQQHACQGKLYGCIIVPQRTITQNATMALQTVPGGIAEWQHQYASKLLWCDWHQPPGSSWPDFVNSSHACQHSHDALMMDGCGTGSCAGVSCPKHALHAGLGFERGQVLVSRQRVSRPAAVNHLAVAAQGNWELLSELHHRTSAPR